MECNWINPFTAPACKIFRVERRTEAPANGVFSGPVTVYFQCHAFWRKSVHMPAPKRRQTGLRVSDFALFFLVVPFKRHDGSEGVKAVGGQIQVTHLLPIVNKTLWQGRPQPRTSHWTFCTIECTSTIIWTPWATRCDVGQSSSMTVLPSQPVAESSIVTFLFSSSAKNRRRLLEAGFVSAWSWKTTCGSFLERDFGGGSPNPRFSRRPCTSHALWIHCGPCLI